MVAMEGSNLEGTVVMGDVGRQCDPQQEKAGGEAHANAAPAGKTASASEVSPQTVLAEANGNGNAHEHSDEPHLGENGHAEVSRDVDLKLTGEYLHLETDMSLAALYRWPADTHNVLMSSELSLYTSGTQLHHGGTALLILAPWCGILGLLLLALLS